MYKLIYSPEANKSWKKIPQKWGERLQRRIETLKQEPLQGKKLQGKFEGHYSIRIWPYRVIYTIFKKEVTILIVDIAHRQSVYKTL